MRRLWLAAAAVLAGCASSGSTLGPSIPDTPEVNDSVINDHREELAEEIEDLAATDVRVDKVDEVEAEDGRSTIRLAVTVSGDDAVAEPYVFDLAVYMADAWDGAPPSDADFELWVSASEGGRSYWWCHGDVMDRLKARDLTQQEWRAACRT